MSVGEKRKYEVVEETSDLPPVGSHHGGNFHVYMSHKIQKLQELHQRAHEEIVSSIFNHCCVFVNGTTNPPLADIRRLITIHGGDFAAYKTSKVTHIICDYLTDAQLKQELGKSKIFSMANHKKVHVVQAKWIIDSIAKSCKQPESDYLPNGLKGRYGSDVRSLFSSAAVRKSSASISSSSAPMASASESPAELVEEVNLVTSPELVIRPTRDAGEYSNISVSSTLLEIPVEQINAELSSLDDLQPWSFLNDVQRDFLKAVPEELRDEILNQVLTDEQKLKIQQIQKSQVKTTNSYGSFNAANIEILSVSSSPMIVFSGNDVKVDNNIDDTSVIILASPLSPPEINANQVVSRNSNEEVYKQTKTSTNDVWHDDLLLQTLQDAINYIHFSGNRRVFSTHEDSNQWNHKGTICQKQRLKLWINSMFDNVTTPREIEFPSSSSKLCHDEDTLRWHLSRTWRLFTFYAEWLIFHELFALWKFMKCLLENHTLCQWSAEDEKAQLWRRMFISSRSHSQECLKLKQHIEAMCATKGSIDAST